MQDLTNASIYACHYNKSKLFEYSTNYYREHGEHTLTCFMWSYSQAQRLLKKAEEKKNLFYKIDNGFHTLIRGN